MRGMLDQLSATALAALVYPPYGVHSPITTFDPRY